MAHGALGKPRSFVHETSVWPVLLRRYPGRADFTTNEWRLWCLGHLNLVVILHFLWVFKCHMGILWVFLGFLWVFMGWSEGRYLVDMLISNLISTFEFMWCLDGTKMYLYDPICMCYWISSLDIDYVSHFKKKIDVAFWSGAKNSGMPWKFRAESKTKTILAEDVGSLYSPIYWGLS